MSATVKQNVFERGNPAFLSGRKKPVAVKENTGDLAADSLPPIQDLKDNEWPDMYQGRSSKYDIYKDIKVGQAITGLSRATANTINNRLRKQGIQLETRSFADGTIGLRCIHREA